MQPIAPFSQQRLKSGRCEPFGGPVSEALITEIYSSFEPFQPPIPAAYVDCQVVRGGWDVLRELGRKIQRSNHPTCQLYTGHRGVGKSTELLRLKDELERHDYFVVYFAADEQDIEPQDAEYADILLACTRHLVEAVQLKNHNPLLDWMKSRWQAMKDLALTEVSFEGLNLESQVAQFAKITANLRAVPDLRREVRQKINAHTASLIDALNSFIDEAIKTLPATCRGLVIIADNLDRIVESKRKGEPSNHDEIYLNRSELLRGLNCHVIYTVPIAMVYSERATRLEDTYDRTEVLPMVMVRNPDSSPNPVGIGKLRELITKRIALIDPHLATVLDSEVFANAEVVDRLCLMSGGHVRNLMQLIQRAIDWTDTLPITAEAVQIAIEEARNTYRNAIQEKQWAVLAQIGHTKQVKNNQQTLRLLLNRCLLEYRYYDQNKRLQRWYNVHPLIEAIEEFQVALAQVESAQTP
jgi:AAA ATPase domain